MSGHLDELYQAIRVVPDFPQPGILFRDITPLLLDAKRFARATALMAEPYARSGITRVVAVESRGFLLGSPIAMALGAGLVPIRKPGKLPGARSRVEYTLEYGTDALEMHSDAITAADRVLVVDDVLATGGTAAAADGLVRQHGAELAGYSFLIELAALRGRERLPGRRVEALLRYT
jgi:adenine phosphoribosyltransferase